MPPGCALVARVSFGLEGDPAISDGFFLEVVDDWIARELDRS